MGWLVVWVGASTTNIEGRHQFVLFDLMESKKELWINNLWDPKRLPLFELTVRIEMQETKRISAICRMLQHVPNWQLLKDSKAWEQKLSLGFPTAFLLMQIPTWCRCLKTLKQRRLGLGNLIMPMLPCVVATDCGASDRTSFKWLSQESATLISRNLRLNWFSVSTKTPVS